MILTLFNLQSGTQSVALILWDQLSEGTPQHHQRSVELFYQLHNLVPSSSICEDVISQQLMHRDKVSVALTCTVSLCLRHVSMKSMLKPPCFSENSAGGPREVLRAVAFDTRFEHHQVFSF